MLIKTGVSIIMKLKESELNIVFESSFIEEAVFLVSRYSHDGLKAKIIQEFHKARENIYQNTAGEDRDAAFECFYKTYFKKLKVNKIFEDIISDFPLLHKPDVMVFVKKVWSKKEEDTELFVEANRKTVCIALMVNRVLQPLFLGAVLRHDLLKISDMLDPEFQYDPHINLAGKNELEDNLIKDRFRILWDIYIDARLRRGGYPAIETVEDQKSKFKKAFFFLKDSEQECIYSRLNGSEDLMQIDLINWSQDARSIKTLGEGGLRCPLCDFMCYDSIKHWPEETLYIAEAVRKDHPQWTIEQGICPQCFDMYNCKIKIKV